MSQRFPPEVHAFIRENVAGRTARELAELTNQAMGTNFTAATMKSYKENHKLRSGTRTGFPVGTPSKEFPLEVAEFIRQNYIGVGPKEMTEILNDRFSKDYSRSQVAAFYKNRRLNSGLTGRFEEGHKPVNKGKKCGLYPGSEATCFKEGHTPHNKLPVGTVLKKHDGYLWKKIGEGCREWRQLHLLLWEEAHGPVPEKHMIIFKDGNKENCVLSNLMMISLAENAIMNRCGLRFTTPEHTETGNLIAKIKIVQKRKLKE